MHSLELWRNIICGNKTGSPGRAVLALHLARSGSQSEHRIRRILLARGAGLIIERFSIAFTANGKRQAEIYQKLVKFICFQLIFCLLVTAMEQVLKTEKQARIR